MTMESLKNITGQKRFHCAHLNIRSLINKHDVLSQSINQNEKSFHILGLSETWLTNQVPDGFIKINDYVCERQDRGWGNPDIPGQIKKGGICLYMNEHLNWSLNSFQTHNRNSNSIEIQWVEIINDKCKNCIIGNGYRPPDGRVGDFLDYLEDVLNDIDLNKFDVFLMGDFNIDFLDEKKS